jgi:predicted CXXCH cytochrome family protein
MIKRTRVLMTPFARAVLCAAVVALCLIGGVGARAQGVGLDGLRCVDCHPSRDAAVYNLLEARGAVHLGNESAQAFVCFSCHDGTITDDLEKLTSSRNHPTSIRMPRKVGGGLPLYGARKIECGTCHTPHERGSTDLDRPGWLRDDSGGVTGMCRACHKKQSDTSHSHMGAMVKIEDAGKLTVRGGKLGPEGQIGCDTCHITHGARYRGLLVAQYGRGDAEGLCALCHSESVVTGKVGDDAAAQPCNDCHSMHVGRENLLAEGDNICLGCHEARQDSGHHPAIDFACRDCHSIHSAPLLSVNNKTRFLRTIPSGGFLCSSCHPSVLGRHSPETLEGMPVTKLMERRGLGASPEERGDCSFCHEVHGAPKKGLLRLDGGISCLYCHETPNPFGIDGKKAGAHPVGVPMIALDAAGVEAGANATAQGAGAPPFAATSAGSGKQEVLMCTTCHGPHGDDRAPPDCGVCHGGQAEQMQDALHSCAQCHPVHGSETAAVRCESCHEREGDSIHGPREIDGELPQGLAAVDPKGLLANVGRFGCPTCHDPHGVGKNILNDSAGERLCFSCHEDKNALVSGPHDMTIYSDSAEKDRCLGCHPVHANSALEAPLGAACPVCHGEQNYTITAHTSEGTPPWKEGRRGLPFFDNFGERNEYGFMDCPTCHDVHRGSTPNALRIDSDKSEDICFKCHPNKRSLLGTAHDSFKEERIPGGSPCGRCHTAHSSYERPSAWDMQTQAGGTINDQKCSACHGVPKQASVPKDGVGSHPVNIHMPAQMKALGLRTYGPSGEPGGRVISCSTCHDVHGTADASGKVRPLFLRFAASTGDLCVRCHKEKEQIRETPHDMASLEERPLGFCSPCHGVHGTGDDEALFILAYDTEAFTTPSGRCRSCHLNSELPLGEPLMQYHMKDADEALTVRNTIFRQFPMVLLDQWAMRSDAQPIIPLFDREQKLNSAGWLQCPSCHDPHIWSPLGPSFTPKLMKGWHGARLPTNFTRIAKPNNVKDSVCRQCHKDEAVKLYWDYHRPNDVVGNSFLRRPLPVKIESEAQEEADTSGSGAVESPPEDGEAEEGAN